MDDLLEDLRYAARQALRRPAFHLLVVAILTVAIGANIAMFTLADAALFRGLPVAEAERLARVFTQSEKGSADFSNASLPQVEDLGRFKSFAGHAGYSDWAALFAGQPGVAPERVNGGVVTGAFFGVIGVDAVLGRALTPADDAEGAAPVVVVSHHYWRTRLGAAPDALGRGLQVNRAPYTIVGVLPAGFGGVNAENHVDLWLPMAFAPQAIADGFINAENMKSRGMTWLDLVVRLAPGATLGSAQAELDAWSTNEAARLAKLTETEGNGPWLKLIPASEAAVDPYGDSGTRRNAWLLGGVVGLLLALACANVAGLLAVRADERSRELALRIGLGAPRGRVVRQLLVECALLAVLGAFAGLVFARVLLVWIGAEAPSGVILPLDPALAVFEPRVLVAALVATTLSVLLAGALPAWRAARVDVAPALKAAGSGATTGRERVATRAALVALQVGLTVVLLTVAGLLLRAFLATAAIGPGFETAGGAVVTINLGRHGVAKDARPAAFERLRERVAALPGVTAAEWANVVPVFGGGMRTSIEPEAPDPKGGAENHVDVIAGSPGYRAALGLRLVSGRDLTAAEAASRAPAIMVNQAMAARFWPGKDPLGQRIKNLATDRGGAVVVGVVSDHRQRSLREAPQPAMFMGLTEMSMGQLQLLVRGAGDPGALLLQVKRAINGIEPELPVLRPQTLDGRVAASYSEARLFAALTVGFALLALTLAAAGLYGVLAHSLRQRRREIGIRLALGATRRRIARLVLGQTGRMVGAGLLLGLGAALAVGRGLEGLLFGVPPRDALTLLGVAGAVLAAAAAATVLPLARATRVDPATALREE